MLSADGLDTILPRIPSCADFPLKGTVDVEFFFIMLLKQAGQAGITLEGPFIEAKRTEHLLSFHKDESPTPPNPFSRVIKSIKERSRPPSYEPRPLIASSERRESLCNVTERDTPNQGDKADPNDRATAAR